MRIHFFEKLFFALVLGLIFNCHSGKQAQIDEEIGRFSDFVLNGQTEEAITMLHQPGFTDFIDLDGHTPLIIAAGAGNLEVLNEVLKYPYDLDHLDKFGHSAVWLAANLGKNGTLEKLLQLGAETGTPDHTGCTPIMAAVNGKNPEGVILLAKAGAPMNMLEDGRTALHNAILMESPQLVQILLDSGSDPTIKCKGMSPLYMAQKIGNREIVKIIMKNIEQQP